MSLPLSDDRYLKAAEGWLDLGNHQEAHSALSDISPWFATHPDVLEMRCRILAASRDWTQLLEVSRQLSELHPARLSGWLEQARAFHAQSKTHLAYHLLVDVVELFPGNQTIRYDIACYAAQRGLLEEAVEWLRSVFESDGDHFYRTKSLADPLLLPIWRAEEVWTSVRALFSEESSPSR